MSLSLVQTASMSGGVIGGSGLGAALTSMPLLNMARTSARLRLTTALRSPWTFTVTVLRDEGCLQSVA